ncbi:MAG: hypothetical protein ACOC0R_03920 [Mariniphaga sp.]
MKTRNFVLTAVALFVAATVSATKLPTLNVFPVEKQKALVSFESPKAASVEISVKSKAGEILYYKKSDAPVENLRMVFDFAELKNGTYDVSLDVNYCKINREVIVSNHHLQVAPEEKRVYKPFCNFEDNLLKVSHLNTGQKNVLLNIYQDGHHIAGRKLGKEVCLQKVFDLSKLKSGQYDIVLSDRDDEYLFTVNK